jgi:hypothetical protein
VLRDGRTADGQLPGKLSDRLGSPGEQLEDLAPGRVAESIEGLGLVSRH